MRGYWIGVASREHVLQAIKGGFCQLSHGKEAPVRRLKKRDLLLFYSPHEMMKGPEALQRFTALGEITDDVAFQVMQARDFHPFRRNVKYFKTREAEIRPMLPRLSFASGTKQWGMHFRRGVFQINRDDFSTIAKAMLMSPDDVPHLIE